MPNYTQFSPDAWGKGYLVLIDEETSFVSQTWSRSVALNWPPASADAEWNEVAARAPDRAARQGEILDEDKDLEGALWPLIRALSISGAAAANWTQKLPHTWHLLLVATFDLRPGLFQLKQKFNRGRPIHVPGAQIGHTVIPTPGHPAYPAGHAAQGQMALLLLRDGVRVKSGLIGGIQSAADLVTDNRVVAGIHFPSDSLAGKRVADQFVPMLLASGPFRQLCDNARTELRPYGVI
jgi:membrane-associated phospholipid phosphatase